MNVKLQSLLCCRAKKLLLAQNEAISEFAFNYRNNPFLLMLHSNFAEISNFKNLLKGFY